jgi:hypothetical protein
MFPKKGGLAMRSSLFVALVLVLVGVGSAQATTWVTLDMPVPGASQTGATGIQGNKIVGCYDYNGTRHGFLYDGTTWTGFQDSRPGPYGNYFTSPSGIEGDTIVGSGSSFDGFILTGLTQWTYFHKDGAWLTGVYGIDGNNIVGLYHVSGSSHPQGYVYDYVNNTWTTIVPPNASFTQASGISGNTVAGYYYPYPLGSSGPCHGFLYDISTASYTFLDVPGSTSTQIAGIQGSNLVGYYVDSDGIGHGFLYDGSTWTTLDMPGARTTYPMGIDGDTIVGCYWDANNNMHGFVTTAPIPEPLTMMGLVFGLGGVGAYIRRRMR